MNWFRIEKENATQPVRGSYKNWKELLAEEGKHQCVYCAVSEQAMGGIRNFHVEHYRPKSLERFEHLTNDIRNLYYACPICNTFKGDDWPNDPSNHLSEVCYAEPSAVDYTNLFMLTTTSEITGKNVAARYMIEKLYLNRPQLQEERRLQKAFLRLENRSKSMKPDVERLVDCADATSRSLLKEFIQLKDRIQTLLLEYQKVLPYRNEDVSR